MCFEKRQIGSPLALCKSQNKGAHSAPKFQLAEKAIGGKLVIKRKDEDGSSRKLLGGHFSCRLNTHQKNWLACEGEALGVRLVSQHFAPVIMENDEVTTIHSDNMPTVHAWRRMKPSPHLLELTPF